MLTQTLPRTTVGDFTVSTIAIARPSWRGAGDLADFQWETVIFMADGESTDPHTWPRVKPEVVDTFGGKNAAIARHGHDCIVAALRSGVNPWTAYPSTAELKAHIRAA